LKDNKRCLFKRAVKKEKGSPTMPPAKPLRSETVIPDANRASGPSSVPLPPSPSVPPPPSTDKDLIFQNTILHEQLATAQEELRFIKEQHRLSEEYASKERERLNKMNQILTLEIARLKDREGSTS
jgi:LAS superfamily LD-carboxypeptidase LdcB